MNLKALREPFPAEDIEWRVQQAGEKNGRIWAMVLAYVTARAIQDRLDEVCGPQHWKNEFRPGVDGGVLCGISIRVGDEWITKWDGAENTDIESVKGGLSGATKRAAVQWGIGRYLYNLTEGWANITEKGSHSAKTKDGKWFKWDPPSLPAWALPQAARNNDVATKGQDKAKPAKSQPQAAQDAQKHSAGVDAVTNAAAERKIPMENLTEYVYAELGVESVSELDTDMLRALYKTLKAGAVDAWLNARVQD